MSKKTETIELRISPEFKERVAELSGQRGQSTSRLIRQLLQREISASADKEKNAGLSFTSRRATTLAMSGIAIVALAVAWNFTTPGDVSARPDVRVTFAEMDLDGDGIITRNEHEAYLQGAEVVDDKEFADFKMPAACEAELSEALQDPLQDFSAFDVNRDGGLDYTELLDAFIKIHTKEFEVLDTNKNGFLDRNELKAVVAEEVFEVSEACDKALQAELGNDDLQDNANPDLESDVRMVFAVLDENRDRKITLVEYLNNQPALGLWAE
ncbi:hypothetical protein [Hoeflea sp. TYP-13]|uniref:hypothetical protein n=1 Tax=Hoeflea sp. TYP-13 TaxID=3230023 RepID=UPI0034C6BF92